MGKAWNQDCGSWVKQLMAGVADGQQILKAMVVAVAVQVMDMQLPHRQVCTATALTGEVVALQGRPSHLLPSPAVLPTVSTVFPLVVLRALQVRVFSALPSFSASTGTGLTKLFTESGIGPSLAARIGEMTLSATTIIARECTAAAAEAGRFFGKVLQAKNKLATATGPTFQRQFSLANFARPIGAGSHVGCSIHGRPA